MALTFLFVSDVDHGPSLLDLFPERPYGGLILLRELEGRLHLSGVVDYLAIQLSTFFNQTLLLLV